MNIFNQLTGTYNKLTKNLSPERYFKEVLSREDFEGLKKLNTESNEIIDWKTLVQDGVCEIEGDKLIGINWPKDLGLYGTNISTLGKLKRTKQLNLYNVKTLTDLGELEEVNGNLYLIGTSIEVQLEALKKIESGTLNVTGYKCFGGNIKGIERLLEKGNIDGNLDLDGLSIELKLEALEKSKNGKLEVTGGIDAYYNVRNIFDKYYQQNKERKYNLDYEEFDKTFGKDIGKIEDEENKKIAIGIIRYEYKKLYRETKNKVKEEIGDVTDNSLTEEQKNKIIELNNEFKESKNRLDLYGVEYEND